MQILWDDIISGLLRIRQRPGSNLLPVLILALGIGGAAAMFSYVDQWMLRPIDYPDPDRLAFIGSMYPADPFSQPLSAPDFQDIRNLSRSFESMSAFDSTETTLSGEHEPERLKAGRVTAEFFPILGVNLIRGRVFIAEEGNPGKDGVVLLTHGLWVRRFASDPNIVGRNIRLDGEQVEVIGVLPERFHFQLMGTMNLYRPLVFSEAELTNRARRAASAIGKLRAGTSVEQAGTELTRIGSNLEKTYPSTNKNRGIRTVTLAFEFGEHQGNRYLLSTFLIFCLVLAIACTNVANLLLSGAVERQREIAVRLSIGASRGRIIRQLLTENVLMVLFAGAIGLVIAMFGIDWMQSMIPEENRTYLPNFGVVTVNAKGMLFTFLIAAIAGVFTGLMPALEGVKVDLNTVLKEGTQNASDSRTRSRLRNLLVVCQVTVALALVITTSLMVLGMRHLWDAEPGFPIEKLLAMKVTLQKNDYGSPIRRSAFYEQALERVSAQSAAVMATVSGSVPFQWGGSRNFTIVGQPAPPQGEIPSFNYNNVFPSYFSTYGIPLLVGRYFTRQDGPDAPLVVIVNDVLVARHFPGGAAIGKKIRFGAKQAEHEIVGVVRNVNGNVWTPRQEQAYVAFAQDPSQESFITVRTKGEPLAMAGIVRKQLMEIDSNQPVSKISTIDDFRLEQTAPFQIMVRILAAAGGFAVLLASIGIYAVISYSVSRRTREMGIRSALGATSSQLLGMIVKQGLKLTTPGLVLGLICALALARVVGALLGEFRMDFPWVYVLSFLLLGGASLIASIVPAARAARVDPMKAMRHD